MKRFIILIPIVLLSSLLGCSDWMGDNQNPNMLNKPPIDALLTGVIEQTAKNQYNTSLTTSMYAQYLASPNASEIDRYGRVTLADCWSNLYHCMADANDLYLESIQYKNYHHAGAALTLLSYNLLIATDLWGDIPFKKAFKGTKILHPEFDSQESIYDTILQNLNYSIELLQQSSPAKNLKGDILYNNQPKQWLKFAFALKARTLIHLSKTSKFNASEVLNAIDASFESNADGAYLYFGGSEINPWYDLVISLKNGGILNGYLSDQFIESLLGNKTAIFSADPRIMAITDTLPGNRYAGTINGNPPPASGFCTLTFSTWYAQAAAPIILLSYPELKFIEAETNLMMQDSLKAAEAYKDGIRSHFNLLELSTQSAENYITAMSASEVAPFSMMSINYQKWIALFLQPEGWVDLRRTDYQLPGMVVPLNNFTGDKFIRRVLYPDFEITYNGQKIPDIDDVTFPLWWDKNKGK